MARNATPLALGSRVVRLSLQKAVDSSLQRCHRSPILPYVPLEDAMNLPPIPTIHAAADALPTGRLSPVELLDACLARIDRYEEHVRAWVFVDRDGARAEAERYAREIKASQWRGPLHGIPIAVKDIFDVFDWPTGCGSKRWANSIA